MVFTLTKKSTASDYTTIQEVAVITVADASAFSVDGDITGDSVAGNDAVGTVQKIVGNVIWAIVTSGAFVAGNNIDNLDPYAAPATAIVSLDSRYYELKHTIENPNINTLRVNFYYTKNIADFSCLAYYSHTDSVDEYLEESLINGSGVILPDTRTHTQGSKNFRMLYNNLKCEKYFLLKITPTTFAGTDALVVAVEEDSLYRLGA